VACSGSKKLSSNSELMQYLLSILEYTSMSLKIMGASIQAHFPKVLGNAAGKEFCASRNEKNPEFFA